MKKNFTFKVLALAAMFGFGSAAYAETGEAVVKMTYVDYDHASQSAGEKAPGDAARAGYNNISGGVVGFAKTSWSCNWITYLQVDASAIEGTITGAKLSLEVSGSTDSKRATAWGVGYNSSEWSADMTYDSADKTITTMGDQQWTSTKSATVFETKEFDILKAFESGNKVVTILVYETAAAGGYVKNPAVTIEYTNAATASYTVKYMLGDVELKESETRTGIVGEHPALKEGDDAAIYSEDGSKKYVYDSNNAESVEIAEDGSSVLVVSFREAAKYAWTAKSNVGTYTISGETWEGDKASVKYPVYQLVDGTLWTKAAINKVFAQDFDVTEDNQEFTLEYTETEISNVVFYAEMEDVEGMAVENSGNADARCSQRAVGYSASGSTKFAELEYGKYSITAAFYSPTSAGGNFKIYAGDRAVMETVTENTNTFVETAEFVLAKSSDILLGQGSKTQAVDYVYVQSLGDPTSEELAAAEAADALAEAKAELAETIAEAEEALAKGKEEVEAQYARTNPEATEEETAAHVTEFCAGFENVIAAAKAELASEEATVETLEAATDVLNVAIASFQQNVATGVVEVKAARQQNDAVYNLAGQRVLKAQKGLFIINGKKVVK